MERENSDERTIFDDDKKKYARTVPLEDKENKQRERLLWNKQREYNISNLKWLTQKMHFKQSFEDGNFIRRRYG